MFLYYYYYYYFVVYVRVKAGVKDGSQSEDDTDTETIPSQKVNIVNVLFVYSKPKGSMYCITVEPQ